MVKIKSVLAIAAITLVTALSAQAQTPSTFYGLPNFISGWHPILDDGYVLWTPGTALVSQAFISANSSQKTAYHVWGNNHTLIDRPWIPVAHRLTFSHRTVARSTDGSFNVTAQGQNVGSIPAYGAWQTISVIVPAQGGLGSSIDLGWEAQGTLVSDYLGPVQWLPLIPMVITYNGSAAVKVSWSTDAFPTEKLYYALSVTGPWRLDTTQVNISGSVKSINVPSSKQYMFWALFN